MAMSDTFTGDRKGNKYGPWLTLKWEITDQQVSNNRSRVKLTLYLNADKNISFSARKTGVIQGSSYAYTGGMRSPGSRVVATKALWVSHNSNGKKSIKFSGNLALNISWSGSSTGTLSVSGTANLKDIPRASILNSASVTGGLKSNGNSTLNLSIDKKHPSYWHVISIYDGSKWILDWGYTSNTPSKLTIDSDKSKRLLNRMPTSTSKSFRIKASTYTGNKGNKIGESVKNVAFTVDSSQKPSVSSTAPTIDGTGWDNKNGLFLEGVSKLKTSMSSSASYGTSISKERITVQGKNYNGNSITTSVLNKGTSTITYYAVDRRGRTNTNTRTLKVEAYGYPSAKSFSLDRTTPKANTAEISANIEWSALSNKNSISLTLSRKASGGIWEQRDTKNLTSSTGKNSYSFTDIDVDVSKSYIYKLELTDSVGNLSNVEGSISTAKVLLNFNEDKGIGIGRMYDSLLGGALQVGGGAHFVDDLFVNRVNLARLQSFSSMNMIAEDTTSFWQSLPQGKYYVSAGDIPNQPSDYGIIDHITQNFKGTGSDYNTVWYSQPFGKVLRKSGNDDYNSSWSEIWINDSVESGSNSNGYYFKFPNGTLICYASRTMADSGWGSAGTGGFGGKYNDKTFTLPYPYVGAAVAITIPEDGGYYSPWSRRADVFSGTKITIGISTLADNTKSFKIRYILMGRWK